MKHIKTPTRYCDEDWMIFDAEDQWIASLDAGEAGPEMVRVLNAHDELVEACKAMQVYFDVTADYYFLQTGKYTLFDVREASSKARDLASAALERLGENG